MADGSQLQLERFTALEEARGPWQALAARSGNLFATWEWVSTWWRHFGAGHELAVAVARRADGELVAIVPLYVFTRRPLSVLRFIGHGPGDWLGPVHAPGDEQLAWDALGEALSAGPRWDVLLAEHIRPDLRPRGALPGSTLRREGFPILPFRGKTWEELLGARSSNFRQQVRRRERRLARDHELRYRLSTDPDALEDDLELLFGLHRAHWTTGGSGAFDSARRAFHRDFAHLALERGWLRLWIMELDREPVAAWYGFRYSGAEWYYQSGRDPAHDSSSVGFVLLCHTIRAAIEDGADAYLFLRGGERYKDRFAEHDPGLETVAVPSSLRGRAAIASTRAFDKLPDVARRRLRALLR